MGMRNSDVSFLRREILPVLERAASISPEAGAAAEAVRVRLYDADQVAEGELDGTPYEMHRLHELRVVPTIGNPEAEGEAWSISLSVEQYKVPYLSGCWWRTGPHAGMVSLTLDDRFGIDTNTEELARWAPFLADAMAVAAGRTSHGPHSYVRNPHGRSGAGDPPPIQAAGVSQTEPVGAP